MDEYHHGKRFAMTHVHMNEPTKKKKMSRVQRIILLAVVTPSIMAPFVRGYHEIMSGEFSFYQILAGVVVLLFCIAISIHARRRTSDDDLSRSFDLAERLEREKH